ncbi:MAG: hypothetical protein GYA21_00300 [Myxococcales bacterium]|nr:hypothetical protein [Myxococcales bacterium]
MKLNEGPAPIAADDKHWVSRGKLLVMSTYMSDSFGVYDPINFKVLDAFHLCDGVGYGLLIDPDERYAAITCSGVPSHPGPARPGDYRKGAGIAIVELDRYR